MLTMKSDKDTPIIALKNVSQVFETPNESLQVIEDVDLTIHQNEFVCVIGPSGCGKSTLLKMIAGYLEPTYGECTMYGEVIKEPDKSRGVVFQSPLLYPWLTVKKNIAYGPTVQKRSKEDINELSKTYLKEVGLMEFENAYPFELSGGMKQRVSIARVLINQPELILMDEPFSALDAITRGTMQTLVRDIWKKSHQTIFLITHDIEEALKLGTRVLVMSKNPGKIVSEYDMTYTNKIYDDPTYHPESDQAFQDDKLLLLQQIS